jgi:hypothetical protein
MLPKQILYHLTLLPALYFPKNKISGQEWRFTPIIPAAGEMEAGGS